MVTLEQLKEEAIKSFCEVWRLVNLYDIDIVDARSGEVLILNNINFKEK